MAKKSPKKKLEMAFHEFIRLRDSTGGYGSCISCGKLVQYPNSDGMWHAGHLYPRSVVYDALRFHEMNTHGQCHFCNTHLEGNTMAFRDGVVARYGEDVLKELDRAKVEGKLIKLYDHDYDEMAKKYRKKNREIKKSRGIEF